MKIFIKASLKSFLLTSILGLYQIAPVHGSTLWNMAGEIDCQLSTAFEYSHSYEQILGVVTTPRRENTLWWPQYTPEMIQAIKSGFICFTEGVRYGFSWRRVEETAEAAIMCKDYNLALGAYIVLHDLAGLDQAKEKAMEMQMQILTLKD